MVQDFSPDSTAKILDFLHVAAGTPDHSRLDALVAAYIRHVPWETAFRIAQRARTAQTADCPRWPDVFWADAMQRGGGGTCYESNYAFFGLLQALGYEGYLTINNMRDKIGCHSAIIILLDGQKWLVDVGLPLYCPLPITPQEITARSSPFLTYSVMPEAAPHYRVERSLAAAPYCFTLIDQPISEPTYRAITTNDYGATGLFLHEIIIHKIIDETVWRFEGRPLPYELASFVNGDKVTHPFGDDMAATIAARFGMDVATLRAAFRVIEAEQQSS